MQNTVIRFAPACDVIDSFGGPSELARLLGFNRTTVARWEMSVAAGGTGGVIPQKRFDAIVALAKRKRIAWVTRAQLARAPRQVRRPLRTAAASKLREFAGAA